MYLVVLDIVAGVSATALEALLAGRHRAVLLLIPNHGHDSEFL